MNLDSTSRLAAIERSGILQASRQQAFMAVCKLAHTLVGATASQLNVLTADEQLHLAEWPRPRIWRKPIPLSESGCREVVIAEVPIVIPDTLLHPIMCLKPWVGEWRGYLGCPVVYDGEVIGSLCALTNSVRHWSQKDVGIMRGLAAQVSDLL